MNRRLFPALATALIAIVAVAGVASAAEVTLVLNATTAYCEAGAHEFGWRDDALTGLDPTDVPEPPPPLGSYLSAAFRLPGVAEPERWRRDLRATADFAGDRREAWELSLIPSWLPATCTVTIAAGSGDAGGLRLILSGVVADTLAVPATFSFPLGSDSHLGIEVVDEALAAPPLTWGAAKCLYR